MNCIFLCGRLTKDPEIRWTTGTAPMCIGAFTLAVDRPGKKDAEKKTDFIPIKVFGQKAEFAEKYLRKGVKINVMGPMHSENWRGDDGKMKTRYEIVGNEIEFCESKKETTEPAPQPDADGFLNMAGDEDLPFKF